jgi:hypothetical protein
MDSNSSSARFQPLTPPLMVFFVKISIRLFLYLVFRIKGGAGSPDRGVGPGIAEERQ